MEFDTLQKQLSQKGELFLCIRVQPKSGKHELAAITEEQRGEKMETVLKLKLKAVPEDGKANEEACILVAELFQVPKRCVTLLLGKTSRDKVVKIVLPS